ncbi:hypothetical protein FRC07_004258 [Ceratobasidium sp. 392]|nr:hypothetical protein FRC07_004258 [Ceratobasidium sp. 392]
MTIPLLVDSEALSAEERQAIKAAVVELLPDAVELLKTLTDIDTSNPPGLNYPVIASVLDRFLTSKGYEVEQIAVPPELHAELVPFSDLPRVNVLAKLKPDPGVVDHGRAIHFNGHVDVVPVGDGESWEYPPFRSTVSNGVIYGRGVSDMKGGIVAQIFAIEALRRAGIPIHGTVEQSGVVDEETTGNRNAGQQMCVSGTEALYGVESPFEDLRVTAVHLSGELMHYFMRACGVIAEAHRTITPQLKLLVDTNVVPPEAQAASLTFTVLHSGTNTNTVPANAVLEFDRRLVSGETLDKARGEIHAVLAKVKRDIGDDFQAEYTELYSTEPTWIGDSPDLTAQEVIGGMKKAIQSVLNVKPGVVCSPGSDDQRFVVHNAGIDACVVYGPGNIRNVHNKDESLSLEDLRTAVEVMAVFTAEFLGKPR